MTCMETAHGSEPRDTFKKPGLPAADARLAAEGSHSLLHPSGSADECLAQHVLARGADDTQHADSRQTYV